MKTKIESYFYSKCLLILKHPFFYVLLNFFYKGMYLKGNSLAGDEPFSVYHAQMPVKQIINELLKGNNPPFYEIILHFWIKIFGISEISVRFPSLIFSSFSVFVIYKISNEFFNKRVAVISCIFFIFSNYHIIYSHESRAYSLLGLLSLCSMYLFLRFYSYALNQKATKTRYLFVFSFLNLILIFTHYFGVLILIVQFLLLIILYKKFKKIIKSLLFSYFVTFLFYIPNLQILFNRFIESSSGTWVKPPQGIVDVYNLLWSFSNAPLPTTLIILLITFTFIYNIKNIIYRSSYSYGFIIIFWFGFLFFSMFLISFKIPIFIERYVMPAAIVFPIFIGVLLNYFSNSRFYKFIVILVLLPFLVSSNPNFSNRRIVKDVIEIVKKNKTQNTVVYIAPEWFEMNFYYYYNIAYFKDYDEHRFKEKIYQNLNKENIFPILHSDQIDIDLIKKTEQVIFLDATGNLSTHNNPIFQKLDSSLNFERKEFVYEIFNIYFFKAKR